MKNAKHEYANSDPTLGDPTQKYRT